jgi:hypothetical protein
VDARQRRGRVVWLVLAARRRMRRPAEHGLLLSPVGEADVSVHFGGREAREERAKK